MSEFAVSVERRDVDSRQVAVVVPRGEGDVDQMPLLRERLLSALDPAPAALVVDLSQVAFLDSSGIGTLVIAARRAREISCEFHLAAPTHVAARALAATALDRIWPIHLSVDEAIAKVGRGGPSTPS